MVAGSAEKAHKDIHLTEEWVRERLNLEREQLDNIKALSLPGTYHEKITTLGNSLHRFTRLKELDLSRNSLTHLNGLEHLKILESLNLYYNQIETLDDLKLLRNNPNIKKLDLRLNPVSKHVADYRQLLISYLPNLEYLDDRPIKDAEKIEASQHFVNLIGPKENKSESRMPISRTIEARDYRTSELKHVLDTEVRKDDRKSWKNIHEAPRKASENSKYDHVYRVTKSGSHFQEGRGSSSDTDKEFKGCYATFTPSPTYSSSSSGGYDSESCRRKNRRSDSSSRKSEKDREISERDSSCGVKISKEFKEAENQFTSQVMHMVEEFWEGPKSLEENPTFLASLKSTFRDYTRKFVSDNKRIISQQQQQIESLGLENAQLSERLREVKSSQESELITLRAKVNQLEDQLRYEQSQRSSVEKMKRKTDEELIQLKHDFNEFQMQAKCQNLSKNVRMTSEIDHLRTELGKYRNLESTVVALKENQKKLMITNEHLTHELSLMRNKSLFNAWKDPNLPTNSVLQA